MQANMAGGILGYSDGLDRGLTGSSDDYDMIMRDDDLNMSGQFSPPHEPEEPGFSNSNANKLGGNSGDNNNEIDSPYADLKDSHLMQVSKQANPDAMLIGNIGGQ